MIENDVDVISNIAPYLKYIKDKYNIDQGILKRYKNA